MKRYFIGRIFAVIPTLLGITFIAFCLGILSPGNPAEIALSQGGYQPSPAQIQAMEVTMGLDQAYGIQYLQWMKKIVQGDLGKSYASNRPVAEEIRRRLPMTLKLSAYAFLLTCVLGLGLGILSAWHKDTKVDYVIMTGLNAVLSLPGFWVGLILILVFAETLKWLPTSGYGGIKHMILPALTLSSAAGATIARVTRGALMAEFGKSYYTAAMTRGLSQWQLVVCNALPNALGPILPMIGNYLGGILGGAAVVESIFAIPGLGSYALGAISSKDYPALQAYVLMTGLVYVIISLGVDLLGLWISPKVRLGENQ